MKLLGILLLATLFTSGSLPAQNNGIPQSSEFLVVPAGDKFLRWYGHLGRSYFLQVSDAEFPLEKWSWVPVIESGNDSDISYEVGGTAERGFYRLKYTNQVPGPGKTLETADFDNDGISNIIEIDPPSPLSAADATDPLDEDTDGDGMKDGYERTHGLKPNDDGSNDPDQGPAGDLDGDGLSNAEELASGSDPDDSDTDGVWTGGVWTPKTAPDITGVFPESVSDDYPDGIGYDVAFADWEFFNNDRKLLQVGLIQPTVGPGVDSPAYCPMFWTEGQSSASLIYETADLWEDTYWTARPLGVTSIGDMILRVKPLHSTSSSTVATTRLDRYNTAGASAGSMDGTGGYHPAIGGWRHTDVTPSGWVASNLSPTQYSSQPSAHRLGLWNAANGSIPLPPEANHWGYPVNVNDLPNNKVVLVGGKSVGGDYTGRVFLPGATGQYQYVPSMSSHQIERFGGDGTAITRDHKLWRNGKLLPLRDLCARYGELLDLGWNLTALKSNKHGVYLIVGEGPDGALKSLLLQPYRFQLRYQNEAEDVFKGWDNTGAEPWASVGVAKTKSIVSLNLVGFTAELAALLEIVPKAGSEGFISLQNQTITGQETRFDITGLAATPTAAGCQIVVREKANQANISKPLNVHVLPPRIVNFVVYHAWDKNNPKSILAANLFTSDAIKKELNATYNLQANISFNLVQTEIVNFDNCSDVIWADGKIYNRIKPGTTRLFTELLVERASESSPAAQPPGPGKHLKLFVVKDVAPAAGKPEIVGLAQRPGSWGIIEEKALIGVYSHEAGHALGLTAEKASNGDFHEEDGVQGPNRVIPLMRRVSGGTHWLRQQDWLKANSEAMNHLYGH